LRDGFVKQQTVAEDVTECAPRAVNQHSPHVWIIADDLPALIAGHPFLQERVELLFGCGFRPKEFRVSFTGQEIWLSKARMKNSSGGIPQSGCLPSMMVCKSAKKSARNF